VDPLAHQVKVVLIQSRRVAKKISFLWPNTNIKKKKQYSSRIGPLKDHNDSEVLDDGLKAKLFNQYFANIGKEIAKNSVTSIE